MISVVSERCSFLGLKWVFFGDRSWGLGVWLLFFGYSMVGIGFDVICCFRFC